MASEPLPYSLEDARQAVRAERSIDAWRSLPWYKRLWYWVVTLW